MENETNAFKEEELLSVLMRSPIGMYVVQDSAFIFTNARFQEITGLTDEELKTIHPLDVVYPLDRDRVRKNAILMLKGQRREGYQFRIMDKVGDFRWIMETVCPITWRGKRAALGYFMDISETAGIRASFMNSPIGIYIISKGKFVYSNIKFREITGYTDEELADISPLNIVVPEDRQMVRTYAIDMIKGHRKDAYEFKIKNKDGKIKRILESVASIRFQDQRAVLGHFMDITDFKSS